MGLGSSEDAVLKLRVDGTQASKDLRKMRGEFDQWAADFAKGMGMAAAAIAATTAALVKFASDGDRVRDVMRNLKISLDAAKEATGHEVSALKLAEAANKTYLAGLNLTAEAYATLAGFAKNAADATGQEFGQVVQQLTEALVSGSVETLRRYGLEIEKTGNRAVDTASMFDKMRENLAKLDAGAVGTADAMNQLKTAFGDLYDQAAAGFADEGPLSRTLEGLTDLTHLFGEGEQGAQNFGRALQGSVMLALGGLAGATAFAVDQIKELLRWLGIMRREAPGGGGPAGAGAVPQEGGGGFSLSYAPTAAGANSPEATIREALRSGMITRQQAMRMARQQGIRLYDLEGQGGRSQGGRSQGAPYVHMEFGAAEISQFEKYGAGYAGAESESEAQARVREINADVAKRAEEMAKRQRDAEQEWREAEGRRLQENWEWEERQLQQRERAIEQYTQMGAAIAQTGVAQIIAGKSAGEAFGAMAKALAQMALMKAIYEGAEAVAAAATYRFVEAGEHATAAAIYAGVAAMAGGVAAVTSSGGGRGGGGYGGGSAPVGPRGGYGGGGGDSPVHISVVVNANGDVVDDSTVRRLGRVVREAGKRGYLGDRRDW